MIASSVAPSAAPAKRRRPGWLPGLAALFFALLTVWLGQWQLGRAEEKRARQAAHDAATALPVLDLERALAGGSIAPYRRVRASGRYLADYQVYLDNRVHQGRAGYHVVAPLEYGSGAVLVNRGWLPARTDRSLQPDAPPPAGVRRVEGVLVPAAGRYLELSADAVQGRVWQNLDLRRYRAWFRADLPELMIQQASAEADGLTRDWPRPDAGVDRHLGYAGQWYSLTAAIVTLYLYYGIWRPHRETR